MNFICDWLLLVSAVGPMFVYVAGAFLFGWGFNELSGLFLLGGLAVGWVGRLGVAGTTTGFLEGMQSLLPAAVLIGPDAEHQPDERAGQDRRSHQQAELGLVEAQVVLDLNADDGKDRPDGKAHREGERAHRQRGDTITAGRIDRTQCCAFSADEGADVGVDEGTPVTEAYKVPFKFTGKIGKVTIELQEMKAANAEAEKDAVREAHVRKTLAD